MPSKRHPPESTAEKAPGDGAGRPLWKGSIAFGLVNVPVALYPLERRSGELSFKLLDKRNHKSVRYKRVNEDTGEEVPWDQIVKGYEYRGGDYVVLSDEDFEKVKVEATQTIEITDFVRRDEIDDAFFDTPYIVLPGKKAEKGYVLLREALGKSEKVGIAKVVIRTKEHLAAVVPKGKALVLVLMRFAHELKRVEDFRLPDSAPSEYRVSDREIKLAEQLVQSMTSKWKPEQYRDDYFDALKAWIEEKAQKGDTAAVPRGKHARPVPSTVIDLAELLRKSMREPASTTGRAKKRAS